ncbi:MAG: hypothetical protein MJK04_21940 [Psychrosphaera sp.]|nr:hypothetical protein [Psychrosphaera sp.]
MSDKINLSKFKQIVIALDKELAVHQVGKGDFSSPQQLGMFKQNILHIISELENRNYTHQNFGMSRAIVDSWPFSSKLGQQIIDVEKEYLNLKQRR